MRTHATADALIWRDEGVSYGWILDSVDRWKAQLKTKRIGAGRIVLLSGNFSPNSIALLLALLDEGCIVVPHAGAVGQKLLHYRAASQAEFHCDVDDRDQVTFASIDHVASHELIKTLRDRAHPGLILFTSGSTGTSKAILHDFLPLCEKFRVARAAYRTVAFLFFDHMGGINTLLHTLFNGGCLVIVDDRSPDEVLAAVAKHRVDLLPTSPTFLNLVLLSEAYKRHDLSSLSLITYGTEPMPATTLKRVRAILPEVRLLQTYGLSELGVLRSKSRDSESLWVKVGGEGFQTRVVDSVLQIKAESTMLGYLNADYSESFTDDGWLITGDLVEVDGPYVRFLARETEVLKVAGEKVYPVEVEDVIRQLDNVAEVTVSSEHNVLVGNVLIAEIVLMREEETRAFTRRLKSFCRERLEPHKRPMKIRITEQQQHSERFKKVRTRAGQA